MLLASIGRMLNGFGEYVTATLSLMYGRSSDPVKRSILLLLKAKKDMLLAVNLEALE